MRRNKVNVFKKMLSMLMVVPVMLSLSLFGADPAPLHLWKLDETAGPIYVDSSPSEANGTCTDPDGCPVPVAGQVNGAQSFDGIDDAIDVTETSTFDWAADANVTIEFWMKSDAAPMGVNDVMIGRHGDSALGGDLDLWYIGIEHTTGYIRCAVGSSSGVNADLTVISGNVVVTDRKWNHIAYVVTSNKIRKCINVFL